jgi:hypothetical protein
MGAYAYKSISKLLSYFNSSQGKVQCHVSKARKVVQGHAELSEHNWNKGQVTELETIRLQV